MGRRRDRAPRRQPHRRGHRRRGRPTGRRDADPWAVLTLSTAFGREVASRAAAAARGRPHRRRGRPRGRGRPARRVEARVRRSARRRDLRELTGADGDRATGMLPTLGPARRARPSRTTRSRVDRARPRPRPRRTRDDDIDVLAEAHAVIGVGIGVGPDEYRRSNRCATLLGAELGATRKVTDKGWLPRARQIGITGRAIAPRLFVSIGASGKFNHSVGVRAAAHGARDQPRPRRADLGRRRHRHRRRLARRAATARRPAAARAERSPSPGAGSGGRRSGFAAGARTSRAARPSRRRR